MAEEYDDLLEEAQVRFKLASDAETENRAESVRDLQFGNGEQWPTNIKRDRELDNRPCLTINITDAIARRIINQCRENRPRIKCHPVGDGADVKTAKVIDGMIRHIENISSADHAYDTAVEGAIRGGWGYWRVSTEYLDEKSFDQEIKIERIRNQFTVYLDPAHQQADGSDANWGFVTTMLRRKDAAVRLSKYGNVSEWTYRGNGDDVPSWANKEEIRLAEYFKVEFTADTLYLMNDGTTCLKSQLPSDASSAIYRIATDANGKPQQSRPTMRRKVMWHLIAGNRVLESREWPGKWIPIVPCYGRELDLNGKLYRKGMIRDMRDPAQMYNYWATTETETVALAPKAPWLIAEGQMNGHEDVWNNANRRSYSALPYKPMVDENGNAVPAPQRQPGVPVPEGVINAKQGIKTDFLAVAGMPQEPGQDEQGVVVSGVAIRKRQGISDISHYDFYDNQMRALKHTGRIMLDLIPKIYDTQRMQRIIREDGLPESVTLNEKQLDPETQAIINVKNNMQVGRYEVVMDAGPAYQTKREESAEVMMQLLTTPLGEKVANAADDLIIREMDFPNASDIADRLAALNPLSQIDKDSDIPPKVQMFIMGLQQQLKQAQQQGMALELELKSKHGLEVIKQTGEDHRAQLKARTDDANSRRDFEGWMHDIDKRSETQIDVAAIHAAGQLLNTRQEAEEDRKSAKELIDKGLATESKH